MLTLGISATLASCSKSGGKYTYETAPDDPSQAKIYTLKNGMKLYLSVYKDAPRVQTMIAVRAGSKNDPSETTGLAHYLEHMLFKGTSRIGALNWEAEKPLLEKISALYEEYRKETDPEKRKAIYAQIDSTSLEASKYVATNEYDKMVSSLGAKGTNAFTSLERTVYVNDIPANELGKWMSLESERFRECVLRLFHTELEAVYEEFNIGQDNDGNKVFHAIMEGLFPSHTYGTQTTIGKGEHLKNPSHVKIQEFFKTYYVPNNMALIISGDIDPDAVVEMAEKYFGSYEPKEVPKWTFQPQPEFTQPVVRDVLGPQKQGVNLAWRFPGTGTDDAILLDLVSQMLSNSQAGLMDLDLVQKQQIGPEAYAFSWPLTDYSLLWIHGEPREGQTLEQVRDLLLGEIEKLKKGEFDEWLIPAVIKNLELSRYNEMENNRSRAEYMLEAFITNRDWKEYNQYLNRIRKFTKQDVVNFANKYFKNNYVCVNKREGQDPNVYKVEKPKITPVNVNRTTDTEFKKAFDTIPSPRIEPVFVDFQKAIQSEKTSNGIRVDFVQNPYNPTFSMDYIVEMGREHDKKLPFALEYLKYLGTDKLSAEDLKKEFYKLGLSFDVNAGDDRAYVTLSGLEESFPQGVKLFEDFLANVQPDTAILKNLVGDELVRRENAKKDKNTILREAMFNFAKFGAKSPYSDVLSTAELQALQASELVDRIKALTGYEHRIFYYGTQAHDKVIAVLNEQHKPAMPLKPIPAKTVYPELPTEENKVFFVNFPMVQAEVMMVSKGTDHFDLQEYVMGRLYNEYFGSGLSSIVFQEIRESKALAYSANTAFTTPSYADRAHYYRAYVGTQGDKMPEAMTAMQDIIDNMPVSDDNINSARESLLKQIESERITKENIYWAADAAAKRGYPGRDLRQEVYNRFKNTGSELGAFRDELVKFQTEKVKNRKYTYLVLGDKTRLNMGYLKGKGPVQELPLETVFGY